MIDGGVPVGKLLMGLDKGSWGEMEGAPTTFGASTCPRDSTKISFHGSVATRYPGVTF